MAAEQNVKFDIEIARQSAEDFALCTQIRCLLLDAEGNLLYRAEPKTPESYVPLTDGTVELCPEMQKKTVMQDLSFGGICRYSCPMGFAFFAAPIMDGGILAGALAAGPSPKKSRDELDALSRQLFANAVYISDSTNILIDSGRGTDTKTAISHYIEYLKYSDGERVPYPIEKEQELFRAVARGDQEMASLLLNQILGHIYFYAVDNEEVYTRIQELLVVLLRAVANSGADVGHIMELSRRYMGELRSLRTQDQLSAWLAAHLHVLIHQVSEASDAKHSSSVYKAVRYIKQKYALNPTLEEVAQYAGYSPAYFSRIFKEDTGVTFSEFLNEVRIEKSKSLLITSSLPIADISSMLGYSDQSYFCRIFKNFTGTTPDRFRKRLQRADRHL